MKSRAVASSRRRGSASGARGLWTMRQTSPRQVCGATRRPRILVPLDRANGARGEPSCQSLAGAPIDQAIGVMVADKMTPAAVELALEIRQEIEGRYDEADQLRLTRGREQPRSTRSSRSGAS